MLIVFGPLVWTVSPTDQDLANRLAGMSRTAPAWHGHPRPRLLSRVLNGGRVSVALAVMAALASAFVGGAIGLVSGYVRGTLDSVLMRIMEVICRFRHWCWRWRSRPRRRACSARSSRYAVPGMPLYARLVRSMVLSVRARDYVLAARAIGVPTPRLVLRHVLPNSMSPLIVQASLSVGLGLQYIAALGYLGLGCSAADARVGRHPERRADVPVQEPLVLVAPGLVIALAIVSFNLLATRCEIFP